MSRNRVKAVVNRWPFTLTYIWIVTVAFLILVATKGEL